MDFRAHRNEYLPYPMGPTILPDPQEASGQIVPYGSIFDPQNN